MKKQNLQKRICPYSGLEFVPKRSNQIFIDNEARIAYNNEKNNEKRKRLAYVNRPLHKNYDILKRLMGEQNEIIVHREYLHGAAINLSYYTQMNQVDNAGKISLSIFHFRIEALDGDNYKITNYERN